MSQFARPRVLTALILLTLSAPFWSLGHPLVEVDDARYAEVPREMVDSGDWATPRLNGFDYVEKPPLWYWLCAASYEVFGVSEASARLPLALLALLALGGVWWLGSWLYSKEAGLASLIVLGSSGLFFFLAHYITPDLALTVWLLWCTAMLLRALLRPQDAWWAGPLAWIFAALAFLSKGLVALVFPGCWTIALLVLYPQLRGRKQFSGLLNPLGPLGFAAIAAPWFILMENRHHGFLHFFFVEQHFQRFLTQKYNRASPWYFFLLVLPAGLLPWTPLALSGMTNAIRRFREEPGDAGLALWVLLVTAFFSKSQSKLATYILPIFPHAALLAARALERPVPAWARRLGLALGVIFLLIWGAALALMIIPGLILDQFASILRVPSSATIGDAAAYTALGVFGAALVAFGWSGRRALERLAAAGLLLGAYALFEIRGNAYNFSALAVSRKIAAELRPGDKLYVSGIFVHGAPFYLRRPYDRVIDWTGELHYAKRDPINAARFGALEDLAQINPAKGRVLILARTSDLERILSNLTRFETSVETDGRWSYVKIGSP